MDLGNIFQKSVHDVGHLPFALVVDRYIRLIGIPAEALLTFLWLIANIGFSSLFLVLRRRGNDEALWSEASSVFGCQAKGDSGWTLVDEVPRKASSGGGSNTDATSGKSFNFDSKVDALFTRQDASAKTVVLLRVFFALTLGLFAVWLVYSGSFLQPLVAVLLVASVAVLYLPPFVILFSAMSLLFWCHMRVRGSAGRELAATEGSADPSGVFMMLVVRLSQVAFELADGKTVRKGKEMHKVPKIAAQRLSRAVVPPSEPTPIWILFFCAYVFFFPGILTGPAGGFRDFLEFLLDPPPEPSASKNHGEEGGGQKREDDGDNAHGGSSNNAGSSGTASGEITTTSSTTSASDQAGSSQVNVNTTKPSTVEVFVPLPDLRTARRRKVLLLLLQAAGCLVVYQLQGAIFPVSITALKKTLPDLPLILRLLYITAAVDMFRFKYYLVWTMADAACVASGYSDPKMVTRPLDTTTTSTSTTSSAGPPDLEVGALMKVSNTAGLSLGVDEFQDSSSTTVMKRTKSTSSYRVALATKQLFRKGQNTDIWQVETSRDIKEMVAGWNQVASQWLQCCVYERCLDIVPNKLLATLVTRVFSALWHGVWAGYYLFFVSTVAITVFDMRLALLWKPPPTGKSLESPTAFFSSVSRWLLHAMLFNNLAVAFCVLTWQDTLYVWQMVAYTPHIFITVFVVVSYLLPGFASKKDGGENKVKKS
ncbi:unnamed protein product [Amoebophrya sp. A25]|nr:unnamed protein product [Amoebophrya sp. A25]|eukprot:GSA25T00008188001.1